MSEKLLFQRLLWAKENLTPVQTKYRVVFEDPLAIDAPARILVPDPNWMASALHGGILPPIEVYEELRCEWTKGTETTQTRINETPGEGWTGGRVINGYLLHETPPAEAMTEEEAIEYLVRKDIPRKVWEDHERSNHRRFLICTVDQIPKDRTWRNTWRVAQD